MEIAEKRAIGGLIILLVFVVIVLVFSAGKTSECAVENCHGLDIQCGPNPPQACTAMYMIGDRCLQYATCGIENGKCQQIENPEFTSCKSCVENCIAHYSNQVEKQFECEGKC